MTSNRSSLLIDDLELTRFVVQKVMTPPVAAFGLAGNVLNIAVLTRPCMKSSSTNCYLTALAIYDMLYLLLVLLMSLSHYEDVACWDFYFRAKHKILRPITDISSNTGVWLTLTFTVERYIGVCHPIRGKVWCTVRRARYVIVAVCVLAAIITTPEFFEKKVISGQTLVATEVTNVTLGEHQDFIRNLSFDKNSKTLIRPSTRTSKLRFHKNRLCRQFPAHLNYNLESVSETTVKEIKLKEASSFSFSNFPLTSSSLSPSSPSSSSSSSSSSSPSSSPSRVCLEASKTLKAVRTDFGNSAMYNLAYLYTNQVLFTFLPLILLMIFNLLLLRQVITASRERRKLAPCQISAFAKGDVCSANHKQSAPEMIECLNTSLQLEGVVPVQRVTVRASGGLRSSQQAKDQQRITIMLITLVVVFILCQLPQSLQNVYRVYRSLSGTLTKETIRTMLITGNVFNFLVIVNCSSNFILYSILSTRFRNTFARICCG